MNKRSIASAIILSSAVVSIGTIDSYAAEKGTVNVSVLNIRSGAGTNHSIVTKAYKGDVVDIIEKGNGWNKVKLSNGKIGWASAQYITIGSNSSSNETSVSGYGVVTTSTLNVRSGAGTNYSIIGKVYKNDKVQLLSKSNGWYKIKLSNGSIGWVSGDYISLNSSDSSTPSTNKADAVVNLAKQQIGKPYVWGAEGPNSFDCSGLMYYIYKNAAGITLPRTSVEQSKVGTTVSKSSLKPGDLIFSSTDGSGNVTHVGVYIGNGEMIHAPKPGKNVEKSNINISYWQNAYLWSKRVL